MLGNLAVHARTEMGPGVAEGTKEVLLVVAVEEEEEAKVASILSIDDMTKCGGIG